MPTGVKRVSWKISTVLMVGALVAPLSAKAEWQGNLTVKNRSGVAIYVTFTVDGVKSSEIKISNNGDKKKSGKNLEVCVKDKSSGSAIKIGYAHAKKHTDSTIIDLSPSSPKLKWVTVQDLDGDAFEMENQSGDDDSSKILKINASSAGNVDAVSC